MHRNKRIHEVQLYTDLRMVLVSGNDIEKTDMEQAYFN